MVTKTDLLFVYGTLRSGFDSHRVLQRLRARYVGQGSVRAELFDLGDFPGAKKLKTSAGFQRGCSLEGGTTRTNSSARVVGEVYRLQDPERAFKVLDDFEDFRPRAAATGLFRRAVTEVALPNGARVKAWVYWLNRVPGPTRRIYSGDYVRRP
jgi:gamma-glutamylcyclotransferase (GGCT)/AIG2-like uncharacterized protein YtfP